MHSSDCHVSRWNACSGLICRDHEEDQQSVIVFFHFLCQMQVTQIALVVLSISGRRVFKVEWTPPTSTNGSPLKANVLSHAAMAVDGAVLASGHTLYAVQLSRAGGMPRTTATSDRSYQVDFESLDFEQFGEF